MTDIMDMEQRWWRTGKLIEKAGKVQEVSLGEVGVGQELVILVGDTGFNEVFTLVLDVTFPDGSERYLLMGVQEGEVADFLAAVGKMKGWLEGLLGDDNQGWQMTPATASRNT